MQANHRQKTSGFTLLENILALGIFVVAVTGVMNVLVKTMELVKDVRSKQTIEVALNSKLAERSRLAFFQAGERRLESKMPDMYFKEVVRELDLRNLDGETLEGLMELQLSVFQENSDVALQTVSIWISATGTQVN